MLRATRLPLALSLLAAAAAFTGRVPPEPADAASRRCRLPCRTTRDGRDSAALGGLANTWPRRRCRLRTSETIVDTGDADVGGSARRK